MTARSRWIAVAAAVLVSVACAAAFGLGYAARGSSGSDTSSAPSAVDIGFCQDMAVHHAQALVMAQDALGRSRNPAVRTIARQILIGQSQERGTLAGWLTDWDAPQLPAGPPMTWMASTPSTPAMDHEMSMDGTAMPGMATQSQLDRLGALAGQRFDVLFLQLMIRHHVGGILMATYAQQHGHLTEVRSTAAAMVIDQTQENAIMTQLLAADGAKPLR